MKLPAVSGAQAVQAFSRIGYQLDRQRGSHILLRHREPPYRRLSVPQHKQLAKGTLRTLIRDAGLTVDQFTRLL